MIRLTRPTEPQWLDLPYGVRVKVLPLDSSVNETANNTAVKLVAALRANAEDAEKAGQPLDALGLTPANPAFLEAKAEVFYIQALAQHSIIEWEGVVGDDGEPLPINEASIEAFAAHPVISRRFRDRYIATVTAVDEEKNGSTPFSPGAGEAAESTAPPAEPSKEPDAAHAPT